MPLQQTSGNVTADAYGGGVAAIPNYIEDVFSTYLYTGNGSTQTINNGIDLAGKGGLQWGKLRSGADDHYLTDTVRGAGYYLYSDGTFGNIAAGTTGINAFTSTGYTLGSGSYQNTNGSTFVSWTFRKQPKFFDVQTATVGASNTLTFSHALGSTPGFIMVKTTVNAGGWVCYHRSLGNDKILQLQSTSAAVTVTGAWTVSSTSVTLAGAIGTGEAVVAYLYAHNAGGFGLTGTDNVISCGSFTDSGGVNTINLGYEPQWVLYKSTTNASSWILWDTMRGMSYSTSEYLRPDLSNAAGSYNSPYAPYPTATGFTIPSGTLATSGNYIYIAIRRGPMKVPTDATKVFTPQIYTGDGTSNRSLTGFGFSPDLVIQQVRSNLVYNSAVADRLRGVNNTGSTIATPMLRTDTTDAEGYSGATQSDIQLLNMDGITVGPNSFSWSNGSGYNNALWNFRRAPSFFDEVCYTGTSSTQNIAHNLGVVPELMIIKDRTSAQGWPVYSSSLGNTKILLLNSSGTGFTSSTYWNSTTPTSSVFTVGTNALQNSSGSNFVAYLFATCAGVSKVGSYTGNGTTQTINCGFTGGARFVLIKRTDSTGDWYVYDTARGMTTLTDPYLLLNSTSAESATLGSVTTVSTGFAVNASILAAINTNGASYIFLAIA